jgi:AhpD family alkylhydroperoxidase
VLEATRRAWGFVPTLQGTLAESPVALQAYTTLFDLVGQSTLTPTERQVAFLAVSVLHGCEYCVAGHTYLARSVGLPEATLRAIRERQPIADSPRLQTLRSFCESVVRERGLAGDAAVDAFIAAGFTRCNVLEVVTVIATKTISNYTNHLTHTPKESFMSEPALKWNAAKSNAETSA